MKPLLQRVPRFVLVLAGLALFGLVRTPFEDQVRKDLIESHLLYPPPARDALEQMGQSTLMGTLGGLRTLVGSFLTLQAFDHFSYKEWEELREKYSIITQLEPRDENHWRDVVWHLGINATANMEADESLPEFERRRRFQQYALQAVDFAERGIEQIPDSVIIRQQLAEVYREKLRDNCAAARVYGDMLGLPGTPEYIRRFHGYFLARCPGREEEAYAYLMSLYRESRRHHLPTLILEVRKLEEKLGIPHPERIRPQSEQRPGRSESRRNTIPGGIVIP